MKVYLDSIGCRLNQSEIEGYARQFRAAGHELAAGPAEADLMVLNTCAVTAAAASDSRQRIRQARQAGVPEIVVTGCMATLDAEKTGRMAGVSRVVHNEVKDRLVPDLLQIEIPDYDLEPIERQPIPGERHKTRAFIKAQDGCDNKCTFCITTVARGAGRSRPIADVVEDVQAALRGGAQEVVLTGVHLGSWGYDFTESQHLTTLIQAILADTDTPRLRVSSLEPWDLDADFFDLWQDPRLCRHLHLPLQSGSAATLRRMARKTTPRQFAALVAAARECIPGVSVTTDIICGFPGETQTEFEQTRAFVESMDFAGAHVFTYSERAGTAAAGMAGAVPHGVRKARSGDLRKVVAASARRYRAGFVGTQADVLWHGVEPAGVGRWQLTGLADNNLRVEASAAEPIWNQVTPVQLTGLTAQGLSGDILALPESLWLG
ncbi:MAG: MiaB/RimO family radical SAM methylthiotransferase [Anaerolineae bacterium]|nr:MAG: MiaB/RimO family radical SAM methylthiotransferase [Anaerolineae bacterium]